MSIEDVDGMDAAAILAGLADTLEMLPQLPNSMSTRQRKDLIEACRSATQLVGRELQREQSYESALAYIGSEWRNTILLSLLGGDGAQQVVLEAMTRRERTSSLVTAAAPDPGVDL